MTLTITLISLLLISMTKTDQKVSKSRSEEDIELNKVYVKYLNYTYNNQCGAHKPLRTYTQEEIYKQNDRLSSLLRFTRDKDDNYTAFSLEEKPIFNVKAILLLIIPASVMAFSILAFTLMSLFFFVPSVFALIYAELDIEYRYYDSNEGKNGANYSTYLYFRVIKQRCLNGCLGPLIGGTGNRHIESKEGRERGLLTFYICKFWIGVLSIIFLLFSIYSICRIEEYGNCGMLESSLKILHGEKGSYFYEFGIFGESETFLGDFYQELEELHREISNSGIDYNLQKEGSRYYSKFFSENAAYNKAIEGFAHTFNLKNYNMCNSTNSKAYPRIFDEYKNLQKNLMERITKDRLFAVDFLKAITSLSNIENHDINEYKNATDLIHRVVDKVIELLTDSQKQLQDFFSSIHKKNKILSIVIYLWILNAFVQLIPYQLKRGILVPKRAQIIFQFLGAIMLSGMSIYLFFAAELMISSCEKSVFVLKSRDNFNKVFGNPVNFDQILMKHIGENCVLDDSVGRLTTHFGRNLTNGISQSLDIMHGLSYNLDAILGDAGVVELNKLEIMLNDEKNNEYFPLFFGENGGISDEFKSLNKDLERCEGDIKLGIGNNDKSIIDMEDTSEKKFEEILLENCKEIQNQSVLIEKYKNLKSCLLGQKSQYESMKKSFGVLKLRMDKNIEMIKSVGKLQKFLKSRFKKSLGRLENRSYSSSEVFDCSQLRTYLLEIVGNACYEGDYVQGLVMVSSILIVCSALLFISGIIGFLEVMIDKVVYRKYIVDNEFGNRIEVIAADFEYN